MYSSELPTCNSKFSGLSLIELMVALAISSLLMLGLAASFKSSSDAHKQLERAGDLIENGRYAISVLNDDISTAGYFGYYYNQSNPPTTLVDPCETSSLSNLTTAIKMPIEGYTAASLTQTILDNPSFDASKMTCDDKGLFTAANLAPGSDVLVIRRADTQALDGTPVDGQIYIQSNSSEIKVLRGNSSAGTVNNTSSNTADGSAQTIRKYPKATTSPDDTYWGDIRKYHVDVYFVAPCITGSNNGVCTAADAANSKNNIPTLKRLELSAASGATTMEIVPLVEGIEYFKVEYGIDTTPSTVNAVTKLTGDSIPDTYVTSPTAAQWPNVVSVRVYLLVRASDKTQGYIDSKTYTLGTVGGGTIVAPANDAYNRHVFSAEIRPMDLAGRREIPE